MSPTIHICTTLDASWLNPNKEFRRFKETTGIHHEFQQFVAFILINKGGISPDDIKNGVVKTIEGTDLNMAFVPIFSSEYFTLGIFNEAVAIGAADYILASSSSKHRTDRG